MLETLTAQVLQMVARSRIALAALVEDLVHLHDTASGHP
jgi:hypothetical protein